LRSKFVADVVEEFIYTKLH